MSQTLNIYCDESCHLLNDGHEVMTLGALWCPLERRREISVRLREIKARHGMSVKTEVKWTKVSPGKIELYMDWLDYFFDDDDLHFRGLIIPNKSALSHESFGQTHDEWYYKMLFTLVSPLLKPGNCHRIYLDHKDTHSGEKARNLHDVLCSSAYDFDRAIIERVQTVTSHESELIQLCDLLIGAVGYANRNLSTSPAKMRFVARMRERSHLTLTQSTLLKASKINLLRWAGGQNRS